VLVMLGLAVATVAPARAAGPAVRIAAHRGGAGLWPEASLGAFRNSIALGVDFLEFDLHMTADGEVVVIHDPTLERTTTGHGAVRDATLADLARVRIKGRDGGVTGEPVPTFAQVLDLAAPTAVQVLPEIKVGPDRKPYAAIEAKVLALLQSRGMLERTTVQAFDPETLARLRTLEPRVRTMLLVGGGRVKREGAEPVAAVRWARDAGATDLGVDYRLVGADVVSAARAAGIRLSVWTVNDEADLRRMIDLGVDIVMTDRPDVARRLLGR
jgi:glycerophosphoryl diester phosphodiesterase